MGFGFCLTGLLVPQPLFFYNKHRRSWLRSEDKSKKAMACLGFSIITPRFFV